MATQEVTINYDNSTDALFRAWSSAWNTALLAIGLTAHSQTGEVDFTTVLKPSAGSQARGFRCYKYNDGLTEYYWRVYWGSGGNGALAPKVWVQSGYRLDGSGNFIGTDFAGQYEFQLVTANVALGTVISRFFKSGAAWGFSPNEAAAGSSPKQYVYLADRTRDASGAATSAGVCQNVYCADTNLQRNGGGGACWQEVTTPGKVGVAYSGVATSEYPKQAVQWSNGQELGVAQLTAWFGRSYPMLTGVAFSPTDVGVGCTVPVSVWGTTHTYRQCNVPGDSTNFWSRVGHIWE